MKQKESLGEHLLIDYQHCSLRKLNNISLLEEEICAAIRDCNGKVVNSLFHHFSPHGLTGVVVIAESHVALHTWPEYRQACLDIFSCTETLDMQLLVQKMAMILGSTHYDQTRIRRGKCVELEQKQVTI